MMRMLSSWSWFPHLPNIIAPRHKGLTLTPVVPSLRTFIGALLPLPFRPNGLASTAVLIVKPNLHADSARTARLILVRASRGKADFERYVNGRRAPERLFGGDAARDEDHPGTELLSND